VKIRLMDTPGECARHLAALVASPFHHVVSISEPRENHRETSAQVRVYVEIRLPGDPGTDAAEPDMPAWTAEYVRMQSPAGLPGNLTQP
jgi:hypothetical protein